MESDNFTIDVSEFKENGGVRSKQVGDEKIIDIGCKRPEESEINVTLTMLCPKRTLCIYNGTAFALIEKSAWAGSSDFYFIG